MSILDKITGRAKKAAGDLTGDGSLRSAGRKEERKGEEKEKLAEAQDRVEEKARTWPTSSAAPEPERHACSAHGRPGARSAVSGPWMPGRRWESPMSGERGPPHVAYRAVLLAAGLLLFGLLFRQLATLMLAVLVTIVIAIPLVGGRRRGWSATTCRGRSGRWSRCSADSRRWRS